MTNTSIFESKDFGTIRTLVIEGKTYFVGLDVARILGYKRERDALARHCRGAVKHGVIDNGGRVQETTLITEGDIYRLVANSKLPSAVKFEAWIFDEVLPSLREQGAYLTPAKLEEVLLNPDTFIKLALHLKEAQMQNEIKQKQLELQAPKVLTYDTYMETNKSHSFTDIAKLCSLQATDIINFLVQKGILRRNIKQEAYPTKAWENTGYFKVTLHPKYIHTRVTPKGFSWLAELINNELIVPQ